MSIYKNYLDLKVISSKLAKKIEQNPNKVSDIYRRSISIGINSLHQIAKKKSVGGYAISILESVHVSEDVGPARIQTTIRIYTKKNTSLDHIRSILITMRYFMDFFEVGEAKIVSDEAKNFLAFVRVRIPTKSKQPTSVEIKKEILDHSPDCNFIYLMPSSSVNGNKRLIRYYYKIVPVECMKPAQYSKPDGYGFSRTNRICGVADF
ncbi:hypothetical protein V6380_16975 [Acinetobacter variabilis]|uniref:hypothetical protein n=1 Tax=Acinetobacter variabilis TaxID=70346 RepID=UPI003B840E9A